MLNRFKDMIDNMQPITAPINVAPEDDLTNTDDWLCRTYNNQWALPTNTHMAKPENAPEGVEYVITGTFVARSTGGCRDMDKYLYTTQWGGILFPTSFSNILNHQGLCWEYGRLNGAEVLFIKKCPMPEPAVVPNEQSV